MIQNIEKYIKTIPTPVLKSLQQACLDELRSRKSEATMDHLRFSATFPGVPHNGSPSKHLHSYAAMLVEQDWSELFPGGSLDKRFYVYAHVKPTGSRLKIDCEKVNLQFNGLPFYIGKGCGERMSDLKRNQAHGVHIRDALSKGAHPSDICHLVADGLTESEAFQLESKLIYLFGTMYEAGRKGILVNLEIPLRPKMIPLRKWQDFRGREKQRLEKEDRDTQLKV